ncbi:hypothetical protein [Streptomyces shenzhenensis]|uniref:hypothetical protein n=1 Tax=Streptomyces shenzhenensis TaxID=943815 RepID=UPI003558CE7D
MRRNGRRTRWGTNSPWRTGFRVDVRLPGSDRLAVAAGAQHVGLQQRVRLTGGELRQAPVDVAPEGHALKMPVTDGEAGGPLIPAERRELPCHRHLLRTPPNSGVSEADTDLFPFGRWLEGARTGSLP